MLIDSSNRFKRRVSLSNGIGEKVISLESDGDLLKIIDRALKKAKISCSALSSVRAELDGESRVGILIGASAANALNYVLGLKKLAGLEFPSDDSGFTV